jgi:hypothetical protein
LEPLLGFKGTIETPIAIPIEAPIEAPIEQQRARQQMRKIREQLDAERRQRQRSEEVKNRSHGPPGLDAAAAARKL